MRSSMTLPPFIHPWEQSAYSICRWTCWSLARRLRGYCITQLQCATVIERVSLGRVGSMQMGEQRGAVAGIQVTTHLCIQLAELRQRRVDVLQHLPTMEYKIWTCNTKFDARRRDAHTVHDVIITEFHKAALPRSQPRALFRRWESPAAKTLLATP